MIDAGDLGDVLDVIDEARERHVRREQGGVGLDLLPHLRRRSPLRFFAQIVFSFSWKATSTNDDPKFTHTAPPFLATAFNMASVMLRGMLVSSRDDECDASTGLLARAHGVPEGRVRDVRQVDDDAEAVHLGDDLPPERA